MNNDTLLLGSLSNDLFRIASLIPRGSTGATIRFRQEADRWLQEIPIESQRTSIQKIIMRLRDELEFSPDLETAEKYLMYAVLLQNAVLHSAKNAGIE